MTCVLLLIPTTSYQTADFLAAANELGVDVVIGSNEASVLSVIGGRSVTVDFTDIDRGCAQILTLASQVQIDAIVPVDEMTTAVAAVAADTLNLQHNPHDAVMKAGNKLKLRECLRDAGISTPQFIHVDKDADGSKTARNISFPCVLKPLTLSASRGVIRADGHNSFVIAFQRIRDLLNDIGEESEAARTILIEQYIPGREVALEGLVNRGILQVLALFDKPDPLEGPYFPETIYVTPSREPGDVQESITRTTQNAISAMGLRDGPIHAELRLNEIGPVIIEVAARSIGGLCSRVLNFGAGVSLEELILRHALSLPIDSLEREKQAAGVIMLPVPGETPGRLVAVEGIDAARSIPHVLDITLSIPIGERIIPLPEGNRYLGFIFARAENAQAVEQALRDAYSVLTFNVSREEI
jgi:biotin carboxylase